MPHIIQVSCVSKNLLNLAEQVVAPCPDDLFGAPSGVCMVEHVFSGSERQLFTSKMCSHPSNDLKINVHTFQWTKNKVCTLFH